MTGAGPYDVGMTLDKLLDRVADESPVLGALSDRLACCAGVIGVDEAIGALLSRPLKSERA